MQRTVRAVRRHGDHALRMRRVVSRSTQIVASDPSSSSGDGLFPTTSMLGIGALLGVGALALHDNTAKSEAAAAATAQSLLPSSATTIPSLVSKQHESESDDEPTPSSTKPRSRRQLLKSRTRHKAKLEEVDLMKIHLDEYKKAQTAIDSLHTRFETYASKTIDGPTGTKIPVMTFTDFLHSLVLPRFHTQSPHPDVTYTCEFMGNADGLITFEECFLLIHLLQIPKEHFDVAFCMFDLDGDGAVDKLEFAHVIQNLLRAIALKSEGGSDMAHIAPDEALPRLIKYLFGRYGKKTIRASELEAVLDLLRKQILQAEFDLYAVPHPKLKGVQVISVHDFAITLLSCFDPERLPPYLERVETLNSSDELVTWEDFYKFHFNVQSNIADIKLAFDLIGAAEITEADFIRAAHVVSGVELSFPVVQLAFRIFDGNDNGTLDQSELLKVLGMRTNVELHKRHTETKMQRFWKCAKGETA